MCRKQIKVNAIKHGTVIDHIAAGKVLKVIEILEINGNNSVMMGMNLSSSKIGKKDIIKIENRELSEAEANSIALISPRATLIIIKDFAVVKKVELTMPETIEKLIICPNPQCITNLEGVKTRFTIDSAQQIVRCGYEKKSPHVFQKWQAIPPPSPTAT
ncbi:MAG: aspartate carbamoyltransferase regulatory subunit, partial [Candidatus Cloacimonadales bacterium]